MKQFLKQPSLQVLARNLEVPERASDFFTFDIPREAIRDGELVIRFERGADVAGGSRLEREVWRNTGGWGTIASEAWLMKRNPDPGKSPQRNPK